MKIPCEEDRKNVLCRFLRSFELLSDFFVTISFRKNGITGQKQHTMCNKLIEDISVFGKYKGMFFVKGRIHFMKKVLSCLLCLFFLPVFHVGAEPIAPELTAPSAILMEASTGQILFEKNSHERLPPASVTKIMTMLLVTEAIDSGKIAMEDMVRCSEKAASMGGSQVYLEPGEEMSVHDMLKAVAVASGNDAAAALAEFVAGSTEGFVAMMNERAKELGMNDTYFVNCNGLDDSEHLTSAYDIALMSKELITHSKIFEFTTIWMDSLRGGKFGLVNTNKLIRFYEGATGLKTGSTSKAKFCLSATAKRNGMDLIAVVLAAPSSKERFADASSLLNFGFANFAVANSLMTEDLPSVRVRKGKKTNVETEMSQNGNVVVSKEKLHNIEKQLTLPESVEAPVRTGEKLGKIAFMLDGEKIGGSDITAKENVNKISPFGMYGKLLKQLLYGSEAEEEIKE